MGGASLAAKDLREKRDFEFSPELMNLHPLRPNFFSSSP
jgi:hypothetical protein